VLLEEQEREHRMRPNADEARHPALEHPAYALRLRSFSHELENVGVPMRAHDLGLNDVHGRADCRCDKARQERSREVR